MRQNLTAVTLLAAILTLLPPARAAGAQTSKPADRDEPQKTGAKKPDAPRPVAGSRRESESADEIKLDTDLVVLDVSVIDKANRPVFDIPKERFTILEGGAQQKIDFFSKEQAPVSLALVLDTSGSMRSKLETVVQAVRNFVSAKGRGDEVALVAFKGEAELVQEFTSDRNEIDDALDNLVAAGSTALLDAVDVAADYVQKEGRNRRKALVVVSDGVETDSYYSFDQIVERLRTLDVRLYLVGFTDDLDTSGSLFKKSQKKKAEALLTKLATETGGRAFLPKGVEELGAITDQISADLRTVYVLGYYPTNTRKDGTFRRVEVKVAAPGSTDDGALTARTRAGYYANKQ